MNILVTGGAGFIGSNFIKYILNAETGASVVNLDKLTYAGNLENLKDVEASSQYRLFRGDVTDLKQVESAFAFAKETFGRSVDLVVHFAAESHVDRSIGDPSAFVKTNVIGTQIMLEAARRNEVSRFIHISTDEVY